MPALVIGHPADPLHPFSDSDMLVEEMPNARLVNAESILEWRISPGRLDDQLAAFIDEVYASKPAARQARRPAPRPAEGPPRASGSLSPG